MIINKIKLENIRSYISKDVYFPEGSVLLSGDIGSGKSTILLAAEFALFGLERGSGSALLRNGKNSGYVELDFDIEGKQIIIKRTLKRTDKSIKQDAGYLIVNGVREEGTATELKAKILDLLNYPKDYLTRSKGLLYKYTVYTPQEEMKRILLESKEDRLHVLRKVFDTDKYKRVQENCTIFLRHLRSETRIHEERLKDKDKRLAEKNEKEKTLIEINKELENIKKELESVKIKNQETKNNLLKYEEEINKLNALRNKFSLIEKDYEHASRNKRRNEDRLKILKQEIKDVNEEDFEFLKKDLHKKMNIFTGSIANSENELKNVLKNISFHNAKESSAFEIKNKVKNLDECPTCYQPVKHEHKERISKEQDDIILKVKIENEKLTKLENEYSSLLQKNKDHLENLRKELSEIESRKIRYENFLKTKKEINEINNQLNEAEKEISKTLLEGDKIKKEIESFSGLEERYQKLKEGFENISRMERGIEIRKSGIDEKINFTNEILSKLKEEIKNLEIIEDKLQNLKIIETWLDEHFISLMGIIEKNVMNKLHSEFEDLFKKWFEIIIGNENLKVELDDEFTPVIVQENFIMDYTDLSGGEKTAVALAYRLSLNQVLNSLVGEVKTQDLLILDEPTDGFSTEQLDRVRLVLDELNMKQIIIVSHEDKIESFVDSVLKFKKINGVSEVI